MILERTQKKDSLQTVNIAVLCVLGVIAAIVAIYALFVAVKLRKISKTPNKEILLYNEESQDQE